MKRLSVCLLTSVLLSGFFVQETIALTSSPWLRNIFEERALLNIQQKLTRKTNHHITKS